MAKTKRNAAQFVGLLLVFAGLILGNPLASYAQSTAAANHNTYFIQGAVKKPGAYRIESAPSLLKLLALAGGLADSHGAAAFIIRRLPAQTADQDPGFKIIQTRIDEMLKGGLEPTMNLEPGDIVNIPPADVFFVAGAGKSAVAYPFTEGVTLLQAIARARGVTSGAKPSKALIFRQDRSNGERQEITVDLDAVTSGKQKDIPLQPNDIVVFSNSQNRITPPPGFLDAPPIRVFAPCRGSRPCMAGLDLSLFEPANELN